jgi:small subunit ribosomal protein S16
MAVVIRLKRTGRKNRPCYRISVADSRFPRDGRTLETLGLYDPISKNEETQSTLNVERAQHWLGAGARPSQTVHSIFKRYSVYGETVPQKKVRKRTGRKKKTKKGEARVAVQAVRTTRKKVRSTERVTAKRAAAKAEKAAAAASAAE